MSTSPPAVEPPLGGWEDELLRHGIDPFHQQTASKPPADLYQTVCKWVAHGRDSATGAHPPPPFLLHRYGKNLRKATSGWRVRHLETTCDCIIFDVDGTSRTVLPTPLAGLFVVWATFTVWLYGGERSSRAVGDEGGRGVVRCGAEVPAGRCCGCQSCGSAVASISTCTIVDVYVCSSSNSSRCCSRVRKFVTVAGRVDVSGGIVIFGSGVFVIDRSGVIIIDSGGGISIDSSGGISIARSGGISIGGSDTALYVGIIINNIILVEANVSTAWRAETVPFGLDRVEPQQ